MTDQTPGNDPLADRVRATFVAERDDIERRHRSQPYKDARRSSRAAWIPLGIAAALIAIAGFAFLGRGDDARSVNLDIASQTGQTEDGSADDNNGDDSVSEQDVVGVPGPTPATSPPSGAFAVAPPLICDGSFGGGPAFVASSDAAVYDQPSADSNLVRQVGKNAVVPLDSECTGEPPQTWFRILDPLSSASSEWINTGPLVVPTPACLVEESTGSLDPGGLAEATLPASSSGWVIDDGSELLRFATGELRTTYLWHDRSHIASVDQCPVVKVPLAAAASPLSPPPGNNECPGVQVNGPVHFVWGIGPDDPDGGLVAHTDANIDSRITEVLPADFARVVSTGGCRVAANGTPWFEVIGRQGPEWVSSNFLRSATRACLLLGPTDGWAVEDGDQTAFAAGTNEPTASYSFFETDAVRVGGSCFGSTETYPICLTSDVVLIDVESGNELFRGAGPFLVERTGRTYVPPSGSTPWIEVVLTVGDFEETGFIDPVVARPYDRTCPAITVPSFPDDLASRPCAIDESTPVTSEGVAGTDGSTADHVHNIRVEQSADCTRVVFEFGVDVFESTDWAAELMPTVEVTKSATSTEIYLPTCADASCVTFSTGQNEPDRVDFGGGSAFIAIGSDQRTRIQLLYAPGIASVTLLDGPARIIVDYRPAPKAANAFFPETPIVGETAILREHIQFDWDGPGLPTNEAFTVTGFARPFEALGRWYVLQVDSEGVPDTENPAASGPMQTTGWTDGWGEFSIEIPALPRGEYIALFGGHSPNDGAFTGSGQYFRVDIDGIDASRPGSADPTSMVLPRSTIGDD